MTTEEEAWPVRGVSMVCKYSRRLARILHANELAIATRQIFMATEFGNHAILFSSGSLCADPLPRPSSPAARFPPRVWEKSTRDRTCTACRHGCDLVCLAATKLSAPRLANMRA